MITMNELDTMVLTHDIPSTGLRAGDVGAVVHRYSSHACEVEFVTGAGETVAVLTLSNADLRPVAASEILHVRALA
jgi:hypothetical protein